MVFENIEQLKRQYTDQYVVVDEHRPELARFRGVTGQVKTVNMSGRALVEFENYIANIGWYDIDLEFLKVVPKPDPAASAAAAKPAAKAAAKAPPPKAPPPKAPAAKSAAPAKLAAGAAGGKPSTAAILAAARSKKGEAPTKAEPASAPPSDEAAEPSAVAASVAVEAKAPPKSGAAKPPASAAGKSSGEKPTTTAEKSLSAAASMRKVEIERDNSHSALGSG